MSVSSYCVCLSTLVSHAFRRSCRFGGCILYLFIAYSLNLAEVCLCPIILCVFLRSVLYLVFETVVSCYDVTILMYNFSSLMCHLFLFWFSPWFPLIFGCLCF